MSTMGATRELSAAPGMLGLSLRAALPLIPGASALPFVAGKGREIPELALTLTAARLQGERLARYAHLCGFALGQSLPATAPHLLAFPLHMALMTDGSFPLAAVGLVHLENRIVVHRPIGVEETLSLRVHATPLQSHPKGRSFAILTEARIEGRLVWEERSTMLRRTSPTNGSERDQAGSDRTGAAPALSPKPTAEWRLPADLGRRYAGVSSDRNPIHMHALTAKLFGFPRAIVHGMWTKARCLAALEPSLPDAYTVDVAFRRPILLPGRVSFAEATESGRVSFAVRQAKAETTIHLEGTVTP